MSLRVRKSSASRESESSRCPYCHDEVLASDCLECKECAARHHTECWLELGRCGSCRFSDSISSDGESVSRPLEARPRVQTLWSRNGPVGRAILAVIFVFAALFFAGLVLLIAYFHFSGIGRQDNILGELIGGGFCAALAYFCAISAKEFIWPPE